MPFQECMLFAHALIFTVACLREDMSFNRGPHTLTVKPSLFKENRTRLLEALKGIVPPNSAVVLAGGQEKFRYNTDSDDAPFRQESYFFWTFGVHESDCYGALDLSTGKSLLFPPKLDSAYLVWMGKINNEDWFKKRYGVDYVEFHEEDKPTIANALSHLGIKNVFLLKAENSDSGATLQPPDFPAVNSFIIDIKTLYPIMANLRVIKTDQELEVMRYAAKIASEAHKAVMRNMRPGQYEYLSESLFRHVCYYYGGCRYLCYGSIAATGENSAVLHYGHAGAPNDKLIRDGDMCMFDMGPEYCCYGSDVSCSYPANGKFTENQKIVYNAVLRANRAVFEAAKPGVRWTDMHLLAEKKLLENLKAAGLVTGDVDEMVNARIGAIFMPHGLGHLIGLEVHDVGGYLGDAIPRSPLPGLKSLRCTRTLQERMVLTIEPGCYFIDPVIDAALADPNKAKFLVKKRIDEFRGMGGVRIEDDVVIWAAGNENMVHVPRTVEEIEDFMAGGGSAEFDCGKLDLDDAECNILNIRQRRNYQYDKLILALLVAITVVLTMNMWDRFA